MRCLYETLAIDKQATDEEIKKAYRKKALIWHPDKNQHRKEQAEDEFKAIQNAYEILSDKHERSWYDSHRDAILRSGNHHQAGGSGGVEAAEKPDNDFNIYMYYSASCHTGHHDGIKGFYAVYSGIFKVIAESEMHAFELHSDPDGSDPPGPFPDFGISTSDKKTVMSFHSFWANFVTVKSFTWADEYNPASAPNRRVRRAMEDENKKSRKTARKEFIEEIRHFAAFVKKRDKRVVKFQKEEEERKAAKKREAEESRKKHLEERRRRAQEYKDPDWVAEAEESDGSCSSVEEVVEYVCVACDKTFRSSKALENHERSKKHRENLASLRQALEAENDIDPDLQEKASSENSDQNSSLRMESEKKSKKQSKSRKKKAKQMKGFAMQKVEEPESGSEENESKNERTCRSQEATFTAFSMPDDLAVSGDSDIEEDGLDDEEDMLARLVAQQGANGGAQYESSQESDSSDGNLEHSERDDSEGPGSPAGCDQGTDHEQETSNDVKCATPLDMNQAPESSSGCEDVCTNVASGEGNPGCAQESKETSPASRSHPETNNENMTGCELRQGRKSRRKTKGTGLVSGSGDFVAPVRGKAKTKKSKGKAKGDGKQGVGEADQEILKCKACCEEFTSRNQMFKHIKDTNHAVWK